MVTIEEVLKEYHPLGTCQQAPPKPPKMAKFNVYYWHRRYPTHKSLKPKARIDEKLKNGDFDYSPYAKYLEYEYWWMAEEIVEIRNSDKSDGWKKEMEVIGVGYRANATGQQLELALGFSHAIIMEIPKEVKVTTVTEKGKAPVVTLESFDKQMLGQVAAKIRSFRKPEPYKGKGIKFVGEEIRRKAGKSAGKK
jgi:hypothetical protein